MQFTKMLLAFGADASIPNLLKQTPLDLILKEACQNDTSDELITLLKTFGAKTSEVCQVQPKRRPRGKLFRRVTDFVLSNNEKYAEKNSSDYEKIKEERDDWYMNISKLNFELQINLKKILEDVSMSEHPRIDQAAALGMQMKEIAMLELAGCRMLFLDGGGMKGIVQVDILSRIEKQSGRKITELFDWIIGTSIGALITLLLVYGMYGHHAL